MVTIPLYSGTKQGQRDVVTDRLLLPPFYISSATFRYRGGMKLIVAQRH